MGLSHRARAFVKLAEICRAEPRCAQQDAFGVYVTGRSACRSARIATSTATSVIAAVDEVRFARGLRSARSKPPPRARRAATVTSIFLGGGTPSLMQPQTVGAILDAIGKHWSVARDVEVTLEANPTSVEATRFRGYRAAGVNRVSLGVQALDDASLKALGRIAAAREALDAVAIARSAFDRYSFDLIYARPDQTPQMWAAELQARRSSEAAEHLSLYQLTIEEGTPFFGLHAAGKLTFRTRRRARALRRDAGGLRASTACPPTRFPTTRAPARSAGTIWSTGAATNMPASVPAPMAASISTASRTPSRPRSVPRPG